MWTNISQASVEGIRAVLLPALTFNTFITWIDFVPLGLSTLILFFMIKKIPFLCYVTADNASYILFDFQFEGKCFDNSGLHALALYMLVL